MALDPRLDKIQKLIALAMKNSSTEEARSAAMKAITLMVEHNVNISLPLAPQPPSSMVPPLGGGFANYQHTQKQTDIFNEFLKHQASQYAQSAARDRAYDAMRNAAQEQGCSYQPYQPYQPSTPKSDETWWDRVRRAIPFVG